MQALAVPRAVAAAGPHLALVGLPGSAALRYAHDLGLRTVTEAFVNRGRRPDGTLVPRGDPGALVTDPDEVGRRAVRLVRKGRVAVVDGIELTVDAGSLCVHSDSPRCARVGTRRPGRPGQRRSRPAPGGAGPPGGTTG